MSTSHTVAAPIRHRALVESGNKKFYECGICEHLHPWDWDADCRQDSARFTLDDLPFDAEIFSWDERQAADVDSEAQA